MTWYNSFSRLRLIAHKFLANSEEVNTISHNVTLYYTLLHITIFGAYLDMNSNRVAFLSSLLEQLKGDDLVMLQHLNTRYKPFGSHSGQKTVWKCRNIFYNFVLHLTRRTLRVVVDSILRVPVGACALKAPRFWTATRMTITYNYKKVTMSSHATTYVKRKSRCWTALISSAFL